MITQVMSWSGLAEGMIEKSRSWAEEHRPVHLEDIVGNEETIERLKIIAKEGNMPNFIISVCIFKKQRSNC